MMVHELKTWPEPFRAVREGCKRHEARVDDRGFAVGDHLRLREWAPGAPGAYTGRAMLVEVTYITPGGFHGIAAGHCVMSIELLVVIR